MLSYVLPIGEDRRWVFLATPPLRPWLEKFARVMNLRPDRATWQEDWPRMVFLRKGSMEKESLVPCGLPESGWEMHDLRSLRFWYHQAAPDIVCEIENDGNHQLEIVRMWLSLNVIYLRTQDSGCLPIHAALLERNGKGVLLASPSGSGKSTSCRRLVRPWHALSDDQALVVRDGRKKYLTNPIPTWSECLFHRTERTWDIRRHVPLSAIFFLEQSDANETFPVGQGEAAMLINDSSTYVFSLILKSLDAEEKRVVRRKIFDNACELAKTVHAFVLRASLTGRFWEEMEKVL